MLKNLFTPTQRHFTLALLLGASITSTWADMHHFGYVTETGTLPAGKAEVEVWNTARLGRDSYYFGLDQRLEFETGITDHLGAALYLNWNRTTESDSNGALGTSNDFGGVSAELKYKFSDPSTDIVGFGLYGELGVNTDVTEIECKTLFDKNLGPWILAGNLIGEGEFENRGMELDDIELQVVAGAAYEITSHFTAGLELRNHNEIEKQPDETFKWMNSALYAGPAVAYTTQSMTVTFTVSPQLPALKTEDGNTFEIHDHEKIEARLHLSLHF